MPKFQKPTLIQRDNQNLINYENKSVDFITEVYNRLVSLSDSGQLQGGIKVEDYGTYKDENNNEKKKLTFYITSSTILSSKEANATKLSKYLRGDKNYYGPMNDRHNNRFKVTFRFSTHRLNALNALAGLTFDKRRKGFFQDLETTNKQAVASFVFGDFPNSESSVGDANDAIVLYLNGMFYDKTTHDWIFADNNSARRMKPTDDITALFSDIEEMLYPQRDSNPANPQVILAQILSNQIPDLQSKCNYWWMPLCVYNVFTEYCKEQARVSGRDFQEVRHDPEIVGEFTKYHIEANKLYNFSRYYFPFSVQTAYEYEQSSSHLPFTYFKRDESGKRVRYIPPLRGYEYIYSTDKYLNEQDGSLSINEEFLDGFIDSILSFMQRREVDSNGNKIGIINRTQVFDGLNEVMGVTPLKVSYDKDSRQRAIDTEMGPNNDGRGPKTSQSTYELPDDIDSERQSIHDDTIDTDKDISNIIDIKSSLQNTVDTSTDVYDDDDVIDYIMKNFVHNPKYRSLHHLTPNTPDNVAFDTVIDAFANPNVYNKINNLRDKMEEEGGPLEGTRKKKFHKLVKAIKKEALFQYIRECLSNIESRRQSEIEALGYNMESKLNRWCNLLEGIAPESVDAQSYWHADDEECPHDIKEATNGTVYYRNQHPEDSLYNQIINVTFDDADEMRMYNAILAKNGMEPLQEGQNWIKAEQLAFITKLLRMDSPRVKADRNTIIQVKIG